jgi:hypothetical protein
MPVRFVTRHNRGSEPQLGCTSKMVPRSQCLPRLLLWDQHLDRVPQAVVPQTFVTYPTQSRL